MTSTTLNLLYRLRHTLERADIPTVLAYGSDSGLVAQVAHPDDAYRAIGILDLTYADTWVDDRRRTVSEGIWTCLGRTTVVTVYGPERKVSR